MYTLFRPGPARLEKLFLRAKGLPLSTPTDPLAEAPQERWFDDRYEVRVPVPEGAAPKARQAATEILRSLEFFPSWMLAQRKGDLVIVGARVFGVWGVFVDRITEEHEEGDDAAGTFEVGFTYATVRGHFETGVESFRAFREGHGKPVRFVVHAISRAGGLFKGLISWLAVRDLQRRFGHDTTARFAALLEERLGEKEEGGEGRTPPL